MLLGLFRWGAPSFVLTAFVEGESDQVIDFFICLAYSPQLGTRLKISHTQLNIVALAANGAEFRAFQHPTWRFSVGGYSSGPIWGRIVDSRGPRILLACSFVSLLGGYSGIRYLYDSGLAPNALSAPAIIFYTLLFCSFLTGVGSAGGFASAVNSTAKTFPDRAVCIHRRFAKFILPLTPTASIHDRSGYIWLWTIGLSLLDYLPYILCW